MIDHEGKRIPLYQLAEPGDRFYISEDFRVRAGTERFSGLVFYLQVKVNLFGFIPIWKSVGSKKVRIDNRAREEYVLDVIKDALIKVKTAIDIICREYPFRERSEVPYYGEMSKVYDDVGSAIFNCIENVYDRKDDKGRVEDPFDIRFFHEVLLSIRPLLLFYCAFRSTPHHTEIPYEKIRDKLNTFKEQKSIEG